MLTCLYVHLDRYADKKKPDETACLASYLLPGSFVLLFFPSFRFCCVRCDLVVLSSGFVTQLREELYRFLVAQFLLLFVNSLGAHSLSYLISHLLVPQIAAECRMAKPTIRRVPITE